MLFCLSKMLDTRLSFIVSLARESQSKCSRCLEDLEDVVNPYIFFVCYMHS